MSEVMNDPCFVFGLELDGVGGGTATGSETDSSQPSWLHIDYSESTSEAWLQARGLERTAVESLTREESRPHTLLMDSGILVVLRGVNTNPGSEPEDMVSLRMWIEPNRLISVRQRRVFSAQDVRASLEHGNGPRTIADLVTELIERIADRISLFVDSIEERVLEFEEAVEAQEPNDLRREVSALRRQTAVVRRYLAPQRDALDTLYRHSKEILDEAHRYAVREQCDRITRYVEDLDLVRERSLVIQEELLNRLAQEQNARMYVLSIVAAIFLPITFITGLFGMNVAGLPGVEDPAAFWIVCGVMAAILVGVAVLFRIQRWF
jgi:zinc transporter